MQVCLPFVYKIEHLKAGKDKPSVSRAISHVEAEMPELSASDVSVAARWRHGPTGRSSEGSCIAWNGAVYRLASPTHIRATMNTLGLPSHPFQGRKGLCGLEHVYGLYHQKSIDWKILDSALSGPGFTAKRPTEASIVATDIEHERIEAQDMVDGLIAVEDVIYMRTRAFMFAVSLWTGDEVASMAVAPSLHGFLKKDLLKGTDGLQRQTNKAYFGLDEQPELETFLETRTTHREPSGFEVDIEQPEMVAFDGRREFAALVMNHTVRTSEHLVGGMSVEQFGRFKSMRDAVQAHFAVHPVPVDGDAIHAMGEFCREMPSGFSRDDLIKGLETLDFMMGRTPSSPTAPQP